MILPDLAGQPFGCVNLNLFAREWLERVYPRSLPQKNPLLDASVCGEMVKALHMCLSLRWSLGGWMEDRRFLWRDSYLEEQGTFLHLGLDLNVPAGQRVAADVPMEVLLVDRDYSPHGWGNRVVAMPEGKDVALIYAHLAPLGPNIAIGARIAAGEIFARTGRPSENGGWFPHLHVQAVRKGHFRSLMKQEAFNKVDGYGFEGRRQECAHLFPDPLQFISVG